MPHNNNDSGRTLRSEFYVPSVWAGLGRPEDSGFRGLQYRGALMVWLALVQCKVTQELLWQCESGEHRMEERNGIMEYN